MNAYKHGMRTAQCRAEQKALNLALREIHRRLAGGML
jgi:hypothetical protein